MVPLRLALPSSNKSAETVAFLVPGEALLRQPATGQDAGGWKLEAVWCPPEQACSITGTPALLHTLAAAPLPLLPECSPQWEREETEQVGRHLTPWVYTRPRN